MQQVLAVVDAYVGVGQRVAMAVRDLNDHALAEIKVDRIGRFGLV